MSADFAKRGQHAMKRPLLRFGHTLLIFFIGTAMIGSILTFVFSASACFWNFHVRCFSIPQDGAAVVDIFRMWSVLALMVALLAATVAHIYRALIWWHALFVIPVAIVAAGMFSTVIESAPWALLPRDALRDPVVFCAVGLVLFVSYQLCLFVAAPGYESRS